MGAISTTIAKLVEKLRSRQGIVFIVVAIAIIALLVILILMPKREMKK